jgi:hypothetical protein
MIKDALSKARLIQVEKLLVTRPVSLLSPKARVRRQAQATSFKPRYRNSAAMQI